MAEASWYVVHTYSGYENKVKMDIEQTVENRGLGELILQVAVPEEEVTEIRNGVRKTVSRKLFPGYVLVNMVMNDDTWYVIRNTRGVTGFVGPGSKPVELSEAEIRKLGIGQKNEEEEKKPAISIDFAVGDTVKVVSGGSWEGTISPVLEINEGRQEVTIYVEMFGRETPTKLDLSNVRKV